MLTKKRLALERGDLTKSHNSLQYYMSGKVLCLTYFSAFNCDFKLCFLQIVYTVCFMVEITQQFKASQSSSLRFNKG